MPTITRFDTMKLKRNELLDFNNKVLIAVKTCSGENTVFTDFEKAATHYAALMTEKNGKVSVALTDYDREADKAWTALSHHLKASVCHPSDEIRDAAEKIREVFDKTPCPTQLNYEQEYGALQNLLSQLDTLSPELFEKSLAEPYRQVLKNAVELFLAAANEKIDTLSKREIGLLPNAVKACGKAWQSLVKYIEYRTEFDATPEITAAFDKLNVLCTEIKRRLEKGKAE